jgi:hypothetical protein
VAGVVVFALSLGGGHAPTGPITRAAFVTTRQSGFRFTLNVGVSVAGHEFALNGSGSIQEPSGRGSEEDSVEGQTVHTILAGPSVYIQTPTLPDGAPAAATPWLKVNTAQMMQAMGGGGPMGNGDPSEFLGFLEAAGINTTVVGGGEIGGVPTTHYHALLDLTTYASQVAPGLRAGAEQTAALLTRLTGQSTLPVDVWVDAQQRVRRVQYGLSMCTKVGTINETIAMNFFDFGPQTAPVPPSAAEVTDLGGQLSSLASQGLQELGAGC